MRHCWLALVVVMVTAADANAKRVYCDCPTRIVLPQPGAQDVPLNTKIWVVEPGQYPKPREPVALVADQEFVDGSLGIRFTPTAETDTVAPAQPRNINGSIVVNTDTWTVETISMFGEYSPDTALVDIDVRTEPAMSTEIVTTPTRLFMCRPNLRVGRDDVRVRVTAIDLAGNRSEPLQFTIKPTLIADHDPDTDCKPGQAWGHSRRYGHGFELLAALFFYAIAMVIWLIVGIGRRLLAKRVPAEPVSLLEAEEVVRRMLRWQVVWCAILLAIIMGLLSSGDGEVPTLTAFAFGPFGLLALGRLALMRRAQSLLARDYASAVRYGRWLEVTAATHSVLVRSADIDFVVAKRNSIPRSVAHE